MYAATIAVWIASEIALGIVRRSRAGEDQQRDRGSAILLWIGITASVIAGIGLAQIPATRMPPAAFSIGLALIYLGLIVRWTAILTLRRYFTIDVAIREDHQLVDHGIYRLVRHPAYTGCLLSFAGLGIAMRNWASLAAILVGTGIVFGYRIVVEERVLREALGERYRAYEMRTKRLIPGIL